MTPKERADSIIKKGLPYSDLIAQAIREAVAEEREACAQIIETLGDNPDIWDSWPTRVATIIRARANTEKA